MPDATSTDIPSVDCSVGAGGDDWADMATVHWEQLGQISDYEAHDLQKSSPSAEVADWHVDASWTEFVRLRLNSARCGREIEWSARYNLIQP